MVFAECESESYLIYDPFIFVGLNGHLGCVKLKTCLTVANSEAYKHKDRRKRIRKLSFSASIRAIEGDN